MEKLVADGKIFCKKGFACTQCSKKLGCVALCTLWPFILNPVVLTLLGWATTPQWKESFSASHVSRRCSSSRYNIYLLYCRGAVFSLISTCTFQGNYDEGFGKEQHKMKWLKDEQGQNANSEC